jgi:hypothetical protein
MYIHISVFILSIYIYIYIYISQITVTELLRCYPESAAVADFDGDTPLCIYRFGCICIYVSICMYIYLAK